ncbi:hypothetical protein Tco_0348277 [Tanacetum coccineum]
MNLQLTYEFLDPDFHLIQCPERFTNCLAVLGAGGADYSPDGAASSSRSPLTITSHRSASNNKVLLIQSFHTSSDTTYFTSFPHPIIILSYSDVDDTFSSTHSPGYIPASSDYFLASPGNTSSNFLDDLTKDLLASLALSPFYDDPYMKVVQAYDTTDNELPIPPQALIAPPTILPPSPVLSLSPMFDFLTFLSSREDFTT